MELIRGIVDAIRRKSSTSAAGTEEEAYGKRFLDRRQRVWARNCREGGSIRDND
jgi:hypothetical protein